MIQRCAQRFSFFIPAVVMSAWGTVMLHTVATGHINRLVSPMFRGYVLAAGVLLVLLSGAYLFLYQAPGGEPAGRLAGRRFVRQMGRWAVLLLPVLAAAVLSPSALSNTTMVNRANLQSTTNVAAMPSMSDATAQSVKDALAADPNQPVPVDVTDLITVGQSSAQAKVFEGRLVHAVGFVVPGDGGPKLLRWLMWCCAADAQPVSVKLSGAVGGPYKDGQWLEVVGKAEFPATLGQVTPTIAVDSIKPTQEPDEPYLSP